MMGIVTIPSKSILFGAVIVLSDRNILDSLCNTTMALSTEMK